MTTDTLPYTIIDARYSGTCRRCKGPIAAGQLIRYYFDDKHAEHALAGECSGPVAKVETPAAAPSTIRDGWYTVAWAGGHRTYRVQTNDADANFAPGKQVIAFLGKDAEFTSFAFVIDGRVVPWKKFREGYAVILEAARFLIAGDHEAAGRMWAMESGKCYRCGRTLTTPQSIAAGIGPYCIGKA